MIFDIIVISIRIFDCFELKNTTNVDKIFLLSYYIWILLELRVKLIEAMLRNVIKKLIDT